MKLYGIRNVLAFPGDGTSVLYHVVCLVLCVVFLIYYEFVWLLPWPGLPCEIDLSTVELSG